MNIYLFISVYVLCSIVVYVLLLGSIVYNGNNN